MTVVFVGASVLRFALYIGGVVAALTLRRRDPKAAVLTGLGFGFVLLSSIVGLTQAFLLPSIAGGVDQIQVVIMLIGLLIGFIELGGLLLIFLGLLRVVRGHGRPAPGVGALR